MTLEQALLSAIGGVVSALVWAVGKLWQRSEQCESDRRELRDEIESLKGNEGELNLRRQCKAADCPFPAGSTFSIKKPCQ